MSDETWAETVESGEETASGPEVPGDLEMDRHVTRDTPMDRKMDLSGQVDVFATAGDSTHRPEERRPAFMGVPIDVTVSIGRARPLVSELIKLQRDSVLTLDSKIEDPVELYIGDRLIARGELQEMDDETGQLGVRLTEVADLSSGV